MSIVVSLGEFVNQMDTFGDQMEVYFNRRTGEYLTVTEEDRSAVEEDTDADLPDWQREILPKVREAISSADWLPLPSRYEFDEYRIMERFCGTLTDATFRDDLLDTIGGRGTFGRFKNMIHRHKVQEEWYRFREQALRQVAVAWLEAHDIPYRE
jgi:hypothetical protein